MLKVPQKSYSAEPLSRLRRIANWAAIAWTTSGIVALLLLLTPLHGPNPFPFGRIEVSLDQVAIRDIPHAELFQDEHADAGLRPSTETVALDISSETDLFEYFQREEDQLQVRCSVHGNANGRKYSATGRPSLPRHPPTRPEGGAPSDNGAPTRYNYTRYAFIDLKADDVVYQGGKPASTLGLKTESFESLRCHVVGVSLGSLLWPRTEDIIVSADAFRALLRPEADDIRPSIQPEA